MTDNMTLPKRLECYKTNITLDAKQTFVQLLNELDKSPCEKTVYWLFNMVHELLFKIENKSLFRLFLVDVFVTIDKVYESVPVIKKLGLKKLMNLAFGLLVPQL